MYEKYLTVRKIETEIYIDCGLTFVFFLKLRNKIQIYAFTKLNDGKDTRLLKELS